LHYYLIYFLFGILLYKYYYINMEVTFDNSCPHQSDLLSGKHKYKLDEAHTCVAFMIVKSKEYKERLDKGEFKDEDILKQKLKNVKRMQEVYEKLKESFPEMNITNAFSKYFILTHDLRTLNRTFKDAIISILNAKIAKLEVKPELELKCGSSTHNPKDDDKQVNLCKICEKPRCSACIPSHLSTQHLAIQIDTFLFQLVEKYNNIESYYVVKIKNITRDIDFYVYRSNSEGGIYRLCTIRRSDDGLNKGTNYVTTTFVHMDLQMFINTMYNNIPNAAADPVISIDKKCPYVDKRYKNNPDEPQTYNEFIEKESRIDKTKIFEMLRLCDCGSCFKKMYIFFQKVLQMHDDIAKNTNFWQAFGTYDSRHKIKKKLYDFLTVTTRYYDRYLVKADFNKFTDADSKMRYIIKEIAPNPGISLENDQKIAIFKNYLMEIGEFLNGLVDDISKPKYIGSYIFIPKKDPYIKLSFDIYSIKMRIKESGTYYDFIVARYKYTNTKNPKYDGTYKAIFNIVPSNASINRLGLYSTYVDAGIYICKIFDYSVQLKTVTTDDMGRKLSYDSSYIFIGDLYKDVFPLNMI